MMTVRPPSVMFAVPVMALRRETLLPESCLKRGVDQWVGYMVLVLMRRRFGMMVIFRCGILNRLQ